MAVRAAPCSEVACLAGRALVDGVGDESLATAEVSGQSLEIGRWRSRLAQPVGVLLAGCGAVAGAGGDEAAGRLRRISAIDERLVQIQAELADLRASAISRLRNRIDEARQQGWDLFAEMILQVRGEIARATARLSALRRSGPTSPNR